MSRDIHKILKGNNIVCIGYANLFSALLSSLNINNRVIANSKGKHARNLVHLIDKKYDIDGIFFFDVTGDAKKSYDSNYLPKYNYFAITLEEASIQMNERLYTLFNMDYEKIENIILDGDVDDIVLLEDAFEMYEKGYFNMFMDSILINKNGGRKIYDKVLSCYKKELSMKAFALALYNVREIEYDHFIIDDIDLKDIKISVINKYLKSILVRMKNFHFTKEDVKDLKLDLYIEMCLNVIPLLDKKDRLVKKLIKKKEDVKDEI